MDPSTGLHMLMAYVLPFENPMETIWQWNVLTLYNVIVMNAFPTWC